MLRLRRALNSRSIVAAHSGDSMASGKLRGVSGMSAALGGNAMDGLALKIDVVIRMR